MRISDWSSDVCSSDLANGRKQQLYRRLLCRHRLPLLPVGWRSGARHARATCSASSGHIAAGNVQPVLHHAWHRSEEHTSELQSLMRISYAVFCLKKKKHKTQM